MTKETVTTLGAIPSTYALAEGRFLRATIDLKDQNCGIRTIAELIDFNARENPNLPFCVQARDLGQEGAVEFVTVSHVQLQHAVARCSAHLKRNIVLQLPIPNRSGQLSKGPPIALLAESDFGLLLHAISLISLGIPALLLSARLSAVAIQHLLAKTGAYAVITSARFRRSAEAALELFPSDQEAPRLYDQAPFMSLLNQDTNGICNADSLVNGSICTTGHYLGEEDRNVLIVHSSGTTGLPKPIYTSHKYLLSFTTCHALTSQEEAQRLCMSTLPLYHAFGWIAPFLSMGVGMTFCLPPPNTIPTGTSVARLLQAFQAKCLITVPSVLEEVSLLPKNVGADLLAALQFVAFGGGPLKPDVGKRLFSAGVRLLNHYGSTETGPLAPIFVPGSDYDYRYFRLRADFDLTINPVAGSDDGMQRYTLKMRPFGWNTDYEVQDQLIQNPSHPKSDYNAVGRNDDVIVLANGEKVRPSILENMLSADEQVSAAIAFGQGQFEIGVIIQPSLRAQVNAVESFKSSIWPILEAANEQMDAHGRVGSKESIVVLSAGVMLPRSDKGSIPRREAYQLFEKEISETYERLEKQQCEDSAEKLDLDDLESSLQHFVQTSLNWKIPAGEWSFNDDLFELGMDSLQAIRLRRFIISSLPPPPGADTGASPISRDFIYSYPSISKLAEALRRPGSSWKDISTADSEVESFIHRYSIEQKSEHATYGRATVVILTGATGSLGAHILARLVALPSVDGIVCLNRASTYSNPCARQREILEQKGLKIPESAWSKIVVFESNTSLPYLGLDPAQYSNLKSITTHILHAAWPMDFNRRIHSFKSSFATLQNLINLAQDSHSCRTSVRPRLLFVSSIAVVGQYPEVTAEAIIPEVRAPSRACANHIGYAQAKFVCERIIEHASNQSFLQVEVGYVRVGQLSGSTNGGFWNVREHVPALVKGSQIIGKLPHLQGTLSWIPVDIAASVISDILFSDESLKLTYHLENPTRQPWHEILESLARALNLQGRDMLPFEDWLRALDKASNFSESATQLTRFFEEDFERMACGQVIMDTNQSRRVSETLRRLRPVSAQDVEKYVLYWKKVGYLQ